MKRILAAVLAFAMAAIVLTACSDDAPNPNAPYFSVKIEGKQWVSDVVTIKK